MFVICEGHGDFRLEGTLLTLGPATSTFGRADGTALSLHHGAAIAMLMKTPTEISKATATTNAGQIQSVRQFGRRSDA